MMKSYELQINGEFYQVDVLGQKANQLTVAINGKEVAIDLLGVTGQEVINNSFVAPIGNTSSPSKGSLENSTPPSPETNNAGTGTLNAPIPGKISAILVKVGEMVKSGQKIMIMEAMKMENEIYTEHDGQISEIFVNTGDTVSLGQPLVKY